MLTQEQLAALILVSPFLIFDAIWALGYWWTHRD
jgi:hypothetical protein